MKLTTYCGALGAAFLLGLTSLQTRAEESSTAVAPDAALSRLMAGNTRFVAGTTTHPDQTVERRQALAAGQHPFALVLTCADSRLSPELIFDQGLGDLFVIRNAGNVLDDHVVGSIEYAVEHLHVSLVVVLGHSKCGAVTAAVQGGEAPGHLRSIVESLQTAVATAKGKPGDPVDNTVRANARLGADSLSEMKPILEHEAKEGHVKIVAARYDVASGKVEVLP